MVGKIYISVDGGGSKTEFAVCDDTGMKIYEKTLGLTNYRLSDREKVKEVFAIGFEGILKDLKLKYTDIAGIVMGISGIDTDDDLVVYKDIIKELKIPQDNVYICNDTEVVFRSLSDEKGLCIVSGTGSIVCAFDNNGFIDRVGGWGQPLSDLGSGYWIGSEILKKIIFYIDKVTDKKLAIQDDIIKHLGITKNIQSSIANLTISKVASIVPIIVKYAENGDLDCMDVLIRACDHLCDEVKALARKVAITNFNLVIVGGVFSNKIFFQMFKERVDKVFGDSKVNYIFPKKSPAESGLIFALKKFKSA